MGITRLGFVVRFRFRRCPAVSRIGLSKRSMVAWLIVNI
jgi:hypothetical protein